MKRAPAAKLTARSADKHVLYQRAVQNPSFEVALITRLFQSRYGALPLSLREDFCGTALLCLEWARSRKGRSATGIDLDADVLRWGREHNFASAREVDGRVTLLNQDVLAPVPKRHDVVCALNYSYWVFRERAQLARYFGNVYKGLDPKGLFLLDCFGGWETQQVRPERRRLRGFTYVWDQAAFNPIDSRLLAHIHFEFPDGSRLRKAFTYDWRLWTLAELRELLEESGFAQVDVLWEGTTRTGEGDNRFRPRLEAVNDPSWIAYLAAYKR